MTDSLIAFIRRHRAAFDLAVPGAHGWKDVEKALDRLKTADAVERELVLNRLLLDTADVPPRLWFAIEAELDRRAAIAAAGATAGDPLETFIANNREAFDSEVPAIGLWGNIVQGIEETPQPAAGGTPELRAERGGKAPGIARWLVRLAAALALLITGLGVGIWYGQGLATDEMKMSQVSNEYAELEQYYQRDIANKQAQLASFTGSQPSDVLTDLEQLDLVMRDLEHELADVPPGNREQVVRAMIENYKAKAAILQRVLERLEQTKINTDPTPDPTQRVPNHEVKSI
jgi:hypothetical protein